MTSAPFSCPIFFCRDDYISSLQTLKLILVFIYLFFFNLAKFPGIVSDCGVK